MARKSTSSSAKQLHQRAEQHNYDDSPSKLRSIIRSKNCDLGTALLIYWRGDPNYFRLFPNRWEMKGDSSADEALFDVLVEIELRVEAGKYKTFEIPFDPFCDIGRTNWAKNHYEFEWDDFYCDLPVQMYGAATKKKLTSVRPASDRPVGLSHIANAEDETFDPKTQQAIDLLEKHNREGSFSGVFIEERDGPMYTPGIHVNFQHQKVPDRIFEHLKSIPGVVDLAFGENSTDSVLKYLKHTPDLLNLALRGAFTARGMSNLKHVGKLQRLSVFTKEKQSKGTWLSGLRYVPELSCLSICGGEFVDFPLESLAKLKKLTELTMLCQFPSDADFRPLQKLNLREIVLGGRKTTDDHIPAILPLSKLRGLRSISFADSRFSEAGWAELRRAFKKQFP